MVEVVCGRLCIDRVSIMRWYQRLYSGQDMLKVVQYHSPCKHCRMRKRF